MPAESSTSSGGAGGGAERDLSESQIAFQIGESSPDEFLVSRYRGTEGLCQLYRFEIELISELGDADFETIVGTPAKLIIKSDFGQRWFHGIVSRFEETGQTLDRTREQTVDQTYYRAELVPAVWYLTHRYDSRIFQQMTAPDIITEVLTKAGIPSDRFRMVLERTDYVVREYCVQYRETDYNFICRLMEEEGIWWCFEQTEEAHILVMADSKSAYKPIPDGAELPFQQPSGMVVSEDHVSRIRRGQCVRPGAVVIDDFDFKNPKLKLLSTSDCGRDPGLEFSDYPGDYLTQSDGKTYAKIRAEEFDSGRIVGIGEANCARLAPGLTFELSEHPSKVMNDSYLVTSVTHQGKQSTAGATSTALSGKSLLDGRARQALTRAARHEDSTIRGLAEGLMQIVARINTGDQTANRALTHWVYHAGQVSKDLPSVAAASGGNPLEALSIPNLVEDILRNGVVEIESPTYECRFECIPADVTYRPPRVTPWPVMRGTQTARVVGPKGEEIHCDKYGRVKVQFNWDRRDKFDDTSSCWIRVSQGMAGGQYGSMFLPRIAQEVIVDFLEGNPNKPIIIGRVYNADHMPPYELPKEKTKSVIKTHSSLGGGGTNEIRFEDLKGSEQLLFHAEKDHDIRVEAEERHNVGANQNLIVGGEQREQIDNHRSVKVCASDALEVTDQQSIVVKQDVFHIFDANHEHYVASEYHLNADKVIVEAGTGISLKVGGSFVVIDSGGVYIKGGQVLINSGGAALASGIGGGYDAPAEPAAAEDVTPGKDDSYSGEETEMPPIEEKTREGHWISISLVDGKGEPVSGEPFEITTPGGKVLNGTLDVNGFARKFVNEPGECQISFNCRDTDEWERA